MRSGPASSVKSSIATGCGTSSSHNGRRLAEASLVSTAAFAAVFALSRRAPAAAGSSAQARSGRWSSIVCNVWIASSPSRAASRSVNSARDIAAWRLASKSAAGGMNGVGESAASAMLITSLGNSARSKRRRLSARNAVCSAVGSAKRTARVAASPRSGLNSQVSASMPNCRAASHAPSSSARRRIGKDSASLSSTDSGRCSAERNRSGGSMHSRGSALRPRKRAR